MIYLITSIGSMSAEAVIQEIKKTTDAKIIGCNLHPKSWTASSRLVDKFYQIAPFSEKEIYLSEIKKIIKKEKIEIIIPLTDPEVDIFSEHYDDFISIGARPYISNKTSIKIARDKLLLSEFFKEKNIPTIPTIVGNIGEKIHFNYPLIAKKQKGRSSQGNIIIDDQRAFDFYKKIIFSKEYIIQPYIPGDIYVVDIVRQADGRSAIPITRQELVRTSNGAGIVVEIKKNKHVCNKLAIDISNILNIEGCINIEFLMTKETPLLMDINPRFSAGVSFSMLAGYNMVKNHLRCFNNKHIDSEKEILEKIYTRSYQEFVISK